MFSDYSDRPLNASAYSDQPFTFLDQAAQNDLANITAISLIENGERAARENWQQRRLTHLLRPRSPARHSGAAGCRRARRATAC